MATRLGLHVTAEELAIWQTRAVSGPYKTTSDVSTNSPGDWDRIATNAATFKNAAHPYQQWAGQTVNSCVTPGFSATPEANRNLGRAEMDCAFYYLVTGDTSYKTPVLADLLAQAAVAGTDFSNHSRWCEDVPYGPLIDENPSFDIANWLTRLLFAYDYIRPSCSGTDQTTLDTWFLNAANFWAGRTDTWLTAAKIPGRMTNDYSTLTDDGVGVNPIITHYGGYTTDYWTQSWSNRSTAIMRFATLVGIQQNNATLKANGKRFFKEVIQYHTFPDGTVTEYYRWTTSNPCLGWDYAALIIGSLVTIADAFGRTGDTELLNYSTSTGHDGTAGGPKSLSQIVTLFLSFVNATTVRYGTATAGNNGNANYRIDTVDNLSGEAYSDDSTMAQANLYYQDATNKTLYLRTASGAPAYPAGGGNTGGWDAWTGEWGIYPGPLFMFGQNEGVVNPFSLTSTSLAPNAPSGLTVHWV